MKKISLLAISAMAFVGCSINSIDEALDASTALSSDRELTIAASFGSASTRIGLEEDENSLWNFTWQENDMLGAKFDEAAVSASVPFYINEGFSDNNADFTGVVTSGAEKVVFTYPHRVTDFDLRNQIVVFDDDAKALNAYGEYYAVLTSEEIAVSDLEEGTITEIPLSAKYTAIELKITGSETVTGTITKAIMSYTSGETTTTTNLSVSNAPALSSGDGTLLTLLIPFSYEPFTTAADDSFTVTCIFEDGQVATFTKSNIVEGVEFTAGTHNYMNVTLYDYATSGVYSGEISTYSADSYPAEGTDIWVVTDSVISAAASYDGLEDALEAAYNAGRTIEVIFHNLTTVVAYAFKGCTSLTSISLPKATEFNSSVFYNCTNLTSISLPKATEFSMSAFENCTKLTSVSLPAATGLGADKVFKGCTNLTSVSLPKATMFGSSTFENCINLTSISLPAAITFTDSAFSSCTSLTSISLPAATTFGNDAFDSCTSLTSISLPAATTFGMGAFYNCTNLTSISLPAATTFGEYAFDSCTSLTSISLPAATTFGMAAFNSCTSLTSISLPKATTFGEYAFDSCTSLTSISLGVSGSGISSIGTDFCDGVTTTDIDLTIKLATGSNCSISDKTLTVNGTDYTFQSIITQ